jgi:hypothetical protein
MVYCCWASKQGSDGASLRRAVSEGRGASRSNAERSEKAGGYIVVKDQGGLTERLG